MTGSALQEYARGILAHVPYLRLLRHGTGYNLGFGLDRLLHGSKDARSEVISNLIVFVPFGFFLSEYLSSTKRFTIGRRFVTLAAFFLSICIELKVGYFEVMDLVLNAVGGRSWSGDECGVEVRIR